MKALVYEKSGKLLREYWMREGSIFCDRKKGYKRKNIYTIYMRNIVLIFVVTTTFRPLFPPAFIRYMSKRADKHKEKMDSQNVAMYNEIKC